MQVKAEVRKRYWKEKSIFYCTPQTLKNDIEKGIVDVRNITCVVVDEAHKASGNYAYVTVINLIDQNNPYFRVLALSATPGKSMEKVQEVIHKLKITHMEVRTDDDVDVKPYIKSKLEEIVEVSNTNKSGSNSKVENISKSFYSKIIGKYSKRRERASRNGSTVVDISIPPLSFKPVALSLSRSPLFKNTQTSLF